MNTIKKTLDYNTKKYYTNESILIGILNHTQFGNSEYNPYFPAINLDPSLFKKNLLGWDVKKACEYMLSHSYFESTGWCARHVRLGIEAGFGKKLSEYPGVAWKYINYLPTIGFKFLCKSDNSYNILESEMLTSKKYVPEPGDIAVYTKGNNTSVPGHICMWTSQQWVSDFRQHNMIVYRATPSAFIFRFE